MACDSLARISKARRALAEAKSLDDVLLIRDEAEAVRHLLKVQGESLASQNEAAEIKIRAERMLGAATAAMDKKGHGRPSKTSEAPTFSQMGIDRRDASVWRMLASLPEDAFEKHVAATNNSHKELTTVSVFLPCSSSSSSRGSGFVRRSLGS